MGITFVTAVQAAWLVHRNERIVRGWIAEGKLHATKDEATGAFQITLADLENVLVRNVEIDRDRLAELERRERATVVDITDAVLERIRVLEEAVRTLQARDTPAQRPPPTLHHDAQPRLTERRSAFASPLPDGWIVVNDMGSSHNLPETTVKRHREQHRWPYEEGIWLVHNTRAYYALTPEQQATFVAFERGNSAFTRCTRPSCPCHRTPPDAAGS